MINDSRVTARNGGGYDVTTKSGNYHVLDAGVMGWGVYTGPNLDMVFTNDGPLIGAAGPEDLIRGLLKADDSEPARG